MVRAWYMDTSAEDQRKPHMPEPTEFVDLETLRARTGILYYKLDADNYVEEGILDKIRKERGYSYEDEVCITEKMENYLEKIATFFKEHIHSDEEIRFITDGSGYFDARDKEDRWIRVEVLKGDMIILPAGIYHRFTLDEKDFIKSKRYFVGEPVWVPINRPADDHPIRKQYLTAVQG